MIRWLGATDRGIATVKHTLNTETHIQTQNAFKNTPKLRKPKNTQIQIACHIVCILTYIYIYIYAWESLFWPPPFSWSVICPRFSARISSILFEIQIPPVNGSKKQHATTFWLSVFCHPNVSNLSPKNPEFKQNGDKLLTYPWSTYWLPNLGLLSCSSFSSFSSSLLFLLVLLAFSLYSFFCFCGLEGKEGRETRKEGKKEEKRRKDGKQQEKGRKEGTKGLKKKTERKKVRERKWKERRANKDQKEKVFVLGQTTTKEGNKEEKERKEGKKGKTDRKKVRERKRKEKG